MQKKQNQYSDILMLKTKIKYIRHILKSFQFSRSFWWITAMGLWRFGTKGYSLTEKMLKTVNLSIYNNFRVLK